MRQNARGERNSLPFRSSRLNPLQHEMLFPGKKIQAYRKWNAARQWVLMQGLLQPVQHLSKWPFLIHRIFVDLSFPRSRHLALDRIRSFREEHYYIGDNFS